MIKKAQTSCAQLVFTFIFALFFGTSAFGGGSSLVVVKRSGPTFGIWSTGIQAKNGDYLLSLSIADDRSPNAKRLYKALGFDGDPAFVTFTVIGNEAEGIGYLAQSGGLQTRSASGGLPEQVNSASAIFLDGKGRLDQSHRVNQLNIKFEIRPGTNQLYAAHPMALEGIMDGRQPFRTLLENESIALAEKILDGKIEVQVIRNLRRALLTAFDPVTKTYFHISEPHHSNPNHHVHTHPSGQEAGLLAFKEGLEISSISRKGTSRVLNPKLNIVTTPEMFMPGYNFAAPPHMLVVKVSSDEVLVVPNLKSPGYPDAEYPDVLSKYVMTSWSLFMPHFKSPLIVNLRSRKARNLEVEYPTGQYLEELLDNGQLYADFDSNSYNIKDLFLRDKHRQTSAEAELSRTCLSELYQIVNR